MRSNGQESQMNAIENVQSTRTRTRTTVPLAYESPCRDTLPIRGANRGGSSALHIIHPPSH